MRRLSEGPCREAPVVARSEGIGFMVYDEAIEIHSYDPSWPDQFESEGVRLLEALGEAVRDIEHVGSTAVEGMAAVPVVDIMIGVDSLEAVARHVPTLQELGYEYYGEAGVADRLYFRKRNDADFDVSIVVHHGEHWQRNLAVRDFLRAHPDRAEEFGSLKHRLVEDEGETHWTDYVDARADFMEELIGEAVQWAGRSG